MKLFEKNTSIIDYQVLLNDKYHLEYIRMHGDDYITIKETKDSKKTYFNNLIKANKFIELDDNDLIVNDIINKIINKEGDLDYFMPFGECESLNILTEQIKAKIEFLEIYKRIDKISDDELTGDNINTPSNVNKKIKRL